MSNTVDYADLNVGDQIPDMVKENISRTQLALFAGASGDHNPIHLDDEEAKSGGLPGVIVHGMLTMAFLGQVLTGWVPVSRVRSWNARFVAMAFPGDTITCKGVIVEKVSEDGENRVKLDISAENQKSEKILVGSAVVAIS
tara:strand:- start:1233 stop:1655 length:423 start_codon:yes stop_codon:yes gene_type:complete